MLSATDIQSATWPALAADWDYSAAIAVYGAEPITFPSKTLYLTSAATASPFPTTSRMLSTTAGTTQATVSPGEFDIGFPGNADAGQWNPGSAAISSTTSSVEIDSTGTAPGTGRQGWLWGDDLKDYRILPGDKLNFTLRIVSTQGSGTAARPLVRASIVTAASGAWTTVKQLFATRITGEASHTTGQDGWRDADARIAPTTTAADFRFAVSAANGHTFAAGERVLIELGFGDADSTTDRTWDLLYNNGSSAVVTPGLTGGPAPALPRRVMLIN